MPFDSQSNSHSLSNKAREMARYAETLRMVNESLMAEMAEIKRIAVEFRKIFG